jgi:hypothetical protein
MIKPSLLGNREQMRAVLQLAVAGKVRTVVDRFPMGRGPGITRQRQAALARRPGERSHLARQGDGSVTGGTEDVPAGTSSQRQSEYGWLHRSPRSAMM